MSDIYEHEDAFKEANRCAGRRTDLARALKNCTGKDTAKLIIEDCKNKYENLFEAFIEGVEFGRTWPKEKTKSVTINADRLKHPYVERNEG